jgi:peptide deformylase
MTVEVQRSASVVVQAQDADGNPIRLAAEGLLAVAVQHELDHLNGVSLADKVGYLRRRMMVKDLMKKKKDRTAK